jgi:hypothetical protein
MLKVQKTLQNLSFPFGSWHQLPTAIWTDAFHGYAAIFTKCAFVGTDHRRACGWQRLMAFFTLGFHL